MKRQAYCPKKTEGEHFHGRVKIYLREIGKQVVATAPGVYLSRTEANQAAAKAGIETLMRMQQLEAYDINYEKMKLLMHDKECLIRCLKYTLKECNSLRARLIDISRRNNQLQVEIEELKRAK